MARMMEDLLLPLGPFCEEMACYGDRMGWVLLPLLMYTEFLLGPHAFLARILPLLSIKFVYVHSSR